VVDYKPTNSELGALVLENRLIKQWRPPGNRALKRTDGWVYVRCRLDIPFPVLEVAREPAAGHAVNVGPLKGKAAAEELADQLNSLFLLRRCGRTLKHRPHASAHAQMGRGLSPCLARRGAGRESIALEAGARRRGGRAAPARSYRARGRRGPDRGRLACRARAAAAAARRRARAGRRGQLGRALHHSARRGASLI